MLTQLKEIVQEIGQIPVLDEALTCVADRIVEVMRIDCCSVYLADYKSQSFELVATRGLSVEAVGNVSIGFTEGLIGLIGQKEEPINIADAHSHPRFKHYPEVEEEFFHAFLGAPIIHQRRVLGVISIQQKRKRKFGQDEEAFLITLAAQMASEVANAEIRGVLRMGEMSHQSDKPQTIYGVPGSPGLGKGLGIVPKNRIQFKDYVLKRSTDISEDIAVYREAVLATKEDIRELTRKVDGVVPEDVAMIFQLYEHLLDANSLGAEVEEKIQSEGWNAPSALKLVVESYRNRFSMMSDPYMRERAIDVEDLGGRVFAYLVNDKIEPSAHSEEIILVAEAVTASMLAEYPLEKVKGIVSLQGSSNSHTAIMARAMGIPAVLGIADAPLSIFNRTPLLLDGYSGSVKVNADESEIKRFETLAHEEKELESSIARFADHGAVTKDGVKLQVLINAGLSIELDSAHLALGDGVGLYRTEIPFMQRERFPSEQEQANLYRTMLQAYPDKEVIMRTLDVGGDKPLPYLVFQEENPFLGWRGIRLTLDHPEIFIVQVRAMLRASINYSNLSIMLPMITSLSEVREARRLINQAFAEVTDELLDDETLSRPKIGVMIEVPAAVYQIPELAKIVDFFSIGSNDLTQYLLAVDRNNPRVSAIYNSLHPAVLRVMLQIFEQSEQHGVPVTVCGEMGSDPAALILLLAMGYRELSINGQNLAKVKWVISQVDITRAQQVLKEVLADSDSLSINEKLNLELENMGLGGLVRAGK